MGSGSHKIGAAKENGGIDNPEEKEIQFRTYLGGKHILPASCVSDGHNANERKNEMDAVQRESVLSVPGRNRYTITGFSSLRSGFP